MKCRKQYRQESLSFFDCVRWKGFLKGDDKVIESEVLKKFADIAQFYVKLPLFSKA